MKKLLLFLFVFFITIASFTQETQFFVGKDANLLIGKTVTPKLNKTFYSGFYKNKKLTVILFKKGVGNDGDKLKGLQFTVIGTIPNPKTYSNDIVLELQNDQIGTVYYSYMPKYESSFLLDVVGGFTPPDGFLCNRLTTEKDKFNGSERINTPDKYEYSILKVIINDTIINTYLKLCAYGSNLVANGKGLEVLFTDSTTYKNPDIKITFKNEPDLKGWTYQCFFTLSISEIELFSTKTISDYRLYVFERHLSSSDAYELKEYLKCLK